MSKKFYFKTVAVGLLTFTLLFGATANMYAAGPEPGANVIYMQGKIDAVVTGVFFPDLIELIPPGTPGFPDGLYQDGFIAYIAGSCGKIPVALDPYSLPVDSEEAFANAIAEDIEGTLIASQGPPNCFSELGGEDLVVIKVKNFSNAESYGGTNIIGAQITLKAIASQ